MTTEASKAVARAINKEANQVLDTFSGGEDAPLVARQAETIKKLLDALAAEKAAQALPVVPEGSPHELADILDEIAGDVHRAWLSEPPIDPSLPAALPAYLTEAAKLLRSPPTPVANLAPVALPGERQAPWLPIVFCPTDGVDRLLRLPDGREVMGAFHNEGFGLRQGWCTSEAVEYDVPVYEEPLRGGFIMPGDEYKGRPESERKQVGTRKQIMHVTGKLPEGVYPTHFRPNDTSWGTPDVRSLIQKGASEDGADG